MDCRGPLSDMLLMGQSRLLNRLGILGVLALSLNACGPPGPSVETNGQRQDQSVSKHDEFLTAYAQEHGIDPLPDVEVVRYVTPVESADVQNECVAGKGWTQLPDGSFQFPTDQEQAFAIAMYECMAAYPVDTDYTGSLTEVQWQATFEYWKEEVVPCLESEGLDVAEPPSEETFLANPTSWSPDSLSVRDQVAERVADGEYPSIEHVFTDVCPVSPPTDVRFADER